MHYYVINQETGARLCQDNSWRTFANFGTYPSCVKVWRMKIWAERSAVIRRHAVVFELPDGQFLDAGGAILQRDEKSGNHTLVGHIDKWLDDCHALDPAEFPS